MVHMPKIETEDSVYLGHGVCGDRVHVCDTSCVCTCYGVAGVRSQWRKTLYGGRWYNVHVLLDQLMVLHILISLPISVKAASFGDA